MVETFVQAILVLVRRHVRGITWEVTVKWRAVCVNIKPGNAWDLCYYNYI